MSEFRNKVVAITGASGGIGQELCRYFGAQGAVIAAIDRMASVAEFADRLRLDGITVESMTVDIVDAPAVRFAFDTLSDRLGAIDILINNAGVSRNPSLERTTPDGFGEDVEANLNGAYHCTYAVLPGMKARRSGAIVNIGSVNGLAALGDAAYSAGKAGLISLTKAIANPSPTPPTRSGWTASNSSSSAPPSRRRSARCWRRWASGRWRGIARARSCCTAKAR